MRGFQLWINLPAQEKMKPASYQDIQPEEIPRLKLPGGGEVKIIAGVAEIDGKTVTGPIQGISTEPLFLDVRFPAGGHFNHSITTGHNAFVYTYEGRLEIGPATNRRPLEAQSAGILSMGDYLEIQTGGQATAFLLLAARPLREPVVQYGPFVMNTREEIEQAMADYKNGQLV
jgi:redox-sensitive bicupin YhaK (pirin superfamily)